LTAPLARRASTAKILAWPAYFIEGYAAAAVGAFSLLSSFATSLLNRTGFLSTEESHVQPLAQIGKRTLDLVVASVVLLVLGALFVPIALAIRLESKGPILYRQLRVGRTWRDRTDLFHLIKFRSMRVDAEASSGAVWASTRDPRITAVGGFLRKTRLDELPQCINVLRGEMSVVGPRPERPVFFPRLEGEIPFYAERTVALRPGITGLAQVNNRYDATMDDVRTKVLFDHAYAVQIASPMRWLRTDFGIMLKTFTVMVMGKGQ
jgi:lipopolysaccharide/colanic/teichoic acid biosynthesis glycosyltransferase